MNQVNNFKDLLNSLPLDERETDEFQLLLHFYELIKRSNKIGYDYAFNQQSLNSYKNSGNSENLSIHLLLDNIEYEFKLNINEIIDNGCYSVFKIKDYQRSCIKIVGKQFNLDLHNDIKATNKIISINGIDVDLLNINDYNNDNHSRSFMTASDFYDKLDEIYGSQENGLTNYLIMSIWKNYVNMSLKLLKQNRFDNQDIKTHKEIQAILEHEQEMQTKLIKEIVAARLDEKFKRVRENNGLYLCVLYEKLIQESSFLGNGPDLNIENPENITKNDDYEFIFAIQSDNNDIGLANIYDCAKIFIFKNKNLDLETIMDENAKFDLNDLFLIYISG